MAERLSPPDSSTIDVHGAAARPRDSDVRGLKIGEPVYSEGDRGGDAYEVLAGVLKSYRAFPDGRRQITEIFHEGDMFGVDGLDRRATTVEAVTDARLKVIDRKALAAESLHAPERIRRLNAALLRRLARAESRLVHLGRFGAVARVAAFLLEEAERNGVEVAIDLELCRQDMADHLGLTVETVCRAITALRLDEIIETPCTRVVRIRDARRLSLAAGRPI